MPPVAPPLLSGHGLQARDQVVLGAGTLHELHKRVGDTVVERAPHGTPVRLTIVGTATLPPIGVTGSSHLEMGTGAVLSYQLIPPAARNLFEVDAGPQRDPGPHQGRSEPGGTALAPGHRAKTGHRNQRRLGAGRAASGPDHQLRIAGHHTDLLLGAALAAGAVVALGITLVTSVRRSGATWPSSRRWASPDGSWPSAVAVQARVAAVIGCAIGIPAGHRTGSVPVGPLRREISAVPYPTVPTGAVVAIGLIAVGLAVLVAMVPGRIAARTTTSQLLRVE